MLFINFSVIKYNLLFINCSVNYTLILDVSVLSNTLNHMCSVIKYQLRHAILLKSEQIHPARHWTWYLLIRENVFRIISASSVSFGVIFFNSISNTILNPYSFRATIQSSFGLLTSSSSFGCGAGDHKFPPCWTILG